MKYIHFTRVAKSAFSSQFSNFGYKMCHKSTVLEPFYAKNANIDSNYLKTSGFSSKNVWYP